MHGTGLRHSSHTVDVKNGEHSYSGGCDQAATLGKLEREVGTRVNKVVLRE